MRWPRRQWRSLLFAFALSLCAHILVLSSVTVHPPRVGDGRAPSLVVTLAQPRVASPAPQELRTLGQPARQVAPVPAAKGTHVRAAPPPAASASSPPPLKEADRQRAFAAPELLDTPPTPLSRPEFGEVARQVEGRRLQVTVRVDEQGVVREAFVKRNEISDEVAARLEQAIASVRFAPARKDGKAVPAVLEARLCFDDAGVLDTHSDECLHPAPTAESGEPVSR